MQPDRPVRRHATQGHVQTAPGGFGNGEREIAGIALTIHRDREAVQIATRPGAANAVAKQLAVALGIALPFDPGSVQREGALSAFRIAPGRWLLAGRPDTPESLAASAAAALDSLPTYLTDMGHGSAIYELSGPDVRGLLAKGSSIDFHPSAFLSDRFAQTSWSGCHVLIDCLETDRFEIHVSRSYALHLLEALSEAALEYRLVVKEPGQSPSP